LTRNGDLAERSDILIDFLDVHRLEQNLLALRVLANGAGKGKEANRNEDENAENQTERIEELGIGGFGCGHGNSLKI
jgi:hypothetical protein